MTATSKSSTECCDCGNIATYTALIDRQSISLCGECYAREFPERAATFELARRAPHAGEFQDGDN